MAKTGTKTPDESDATKKRKAKLLDALELSVGVVTTACRAVNISRDTHYRWMKEDPDYKARVEELENVALDLSESKLFENIMSGDTTAIIFHLKTKGKGRGYTERIEHKDVTDFNERYKDKTPEQIAAELSEVAKKMANVVST